MTFDRTVTVISITVAVIASLAASVQSFISWKGRNDPLISSVLAEVAKDCHDLANEAGNAVGRTVPGEYTQRLSAEAAALDLLIDAIDPMNRRQIGTAVEIFLDEEFDRVAASTNPPSEKTPMQKRDVEIRFMVNLNNRCSEVIRKQL
jgi:enolase